MAGAETPSPNGAGATNVVSLHIHGPKSLLFKSITVQALNSQLNETWQELLTRIGVIIPTNRQIFVNTRRRADIRNGWRATLKDQVKVLIGRYATGNGRARLGTYTVILTYSSGEKRDPAGRGGARSSTTSSTDNRIDVASLRDQGRSSIGITGTTNTDNGQVAGSSRALTLEFKEETRDSMEVMVNRPEELSPLENHLILERVFSFCKFKDLKSCRLVSRSWRRNSLMSWKSSSVTKVDSLSHNRSLFGKTMSDLMKFFENYSENQMPFANYNLQGYENEYFHQFWPVCGSSVKTLVLGHMRFKSVKDLLSLVFTSCPNLEELDLSSILDNKNGAAAPLSAEVQFVGEKLKLKSLKMFFCVWESVSWMWLLCRCPLLKTLKISSRIHNPEELIRSLKGIREEDPNKLKLTEIIISEEGSEDIDYSPILLDLNLQLKGLSINFGFHKRNMARQLPHVLNVHAAHLTRLEFNANRSDRAIFDSNFPQLPSQMILENVRELKISCRLVFQSMSFLKLTPNLEKLITDAGGCERLVQRTPDFMDLKLEKCKYFEGNLMDATIADFQKFIQWIPNVETLKIGHLNNEMFQKICELCSSLVNLEVNYSSVDDRGLTGLDYEDVRRINAGNEDGSSWMPITAPRANVTSLKNLKSLYLENQSHFWEHYSDSDSDMSEEDEVENLRYSREPPIRIPYLTVSGCGAVFGILMSSNLEHLCIKNYRMENPSWWKILHAVYPWP